MNKYIVINENTLGYILEGMEFQWVKVLAGSVVRGGRNPLDGYFPLSPLDTVRNATLKDFEDYRIDSRGHI